MPGAYPSELILLAIAKHGHLDPSSIDGSNRLSDLGLGSLQMLQLMLEIEEALGQELDDERMTQVLSSSTVDDLCVAFAALSPHNDASPYRVAAP
jgi:acyl carrier protein